MGEPTGFTYLRRKNGEVVISHNGRYAVTLRGSKADRFIVDISIRDPQQVMARVTANYKRGNERT